jgi:transcription initiation factor TFIIIB Brf1 subunit/transcription initiation factor TFIIB
MSAVNDSTCVCSHTTTEILNGVIECAECGEHLEDVMDQEQEWRYYGDTDNKNTSNPSRCQSRKIPDKGIRKDLEKLNLPTQVINLADAYYFEVTQGEIKRGNLRKGIVFACVFEAYKDINKLQLPDQLRKLFCIDKKNGSRGITYFFRKKKKTDRQYITAEHFIPKLCEKFNFTPEGVEEVLELYRVLKTKSQTIDHSYPQSVSSGCVFYMLKKKNVDITGVQFGKIVDLSSITVLKKTAEIEEIMNGD